MKQHSAMRLTIGFALLVVCVLVSGVLSLVAGSSSLTAGEVLSVLTGRNTEPGAVMIVMQIRLPRLIAAFALGGALSVSGFLLQCFFGNPIAGPFVLGISSGAKLTVALTLVLCLQRGIILGSWALVAASFAGALLSTGWVLLFSGKVRSMALLIVSGVMLGYICSAVTELVVTFADESNIVNLHNWSQGSFSGTDWSDVRMLCLVVGAAMLLTIGIAKPLAAYQLGESYAESVGVELKQFRAAVILLSSVLSACVTAFAGPVSFVGVAVPHLVKCLFGTAKPLIILPAAFLGGGAFCLACDLAARLLFAPTELSISTVTAVIGAPIVIWILLRRQKRREAA